MKIEENRIVLDPNSWDDAEYWYENEEDIYDMMQEFRESIFSLAQDKNVPISQAILIFAKNIGLR